MFLVIALIVLLGTAACSSAPAVTNALPTAPPSSAPVQTGASISVENFQFVPQTLTIKVGDTVTWTNNDTAGHNIAIPSLNYTSDIFAQGAKSTYKFDKAGSYPYNCGVHPSMTGTVVVQ